MNTVPDKNDGALGKALREWRVSEPLPPRFQEQVWRRIEAAHAGEPASLWATLLNALNALAARRKFAFSYVTAALVVGLALGFWQARQVNTALDSGLGQRYIQSVDPYSKTGHL
jgi:hypothetical protein